MKSKKENKKQVFRHPAFAVVTLLIAVICLAAYAFVPQYDYRANGGKVRFENPNIFCGSQNGRQVIVDDGDSIYCFDENNEIVYTVSVEQFPYENAEMTDAAFGADERLYCHVAVYNEDAHLTDAEMVFEIDSEGNIVREVVHYDYRNTENPPCHQTFIYGLHFRDGRLRYIYKENTAKANSKGAGITLMEVDPDVPQHTRELYVEQDGFGEIIKCHAAQDDSFLVLKNNGEIARISYDGTYDLLYKAEYNTRTSEGMFPCDVYETDDGIYMLEGQERLTLYKQSENIQPETVCADDTYDANVWKKLIVIDSELGMSEDIDLYAYGLGSIGSKVGLHVNDAVYVMEDDNCLQPYCEALRLPGEVAFWMGLKRILPIVGILFFIVGLISGIGNLLGWRMTILSKQLLSTIPVVFIMLAAVTGTMLIGVIEMNTDDVVRETIAINEIAAAQFDGEELKTITGFENVDNGQVEIIKEQLHEFMNGNQSGWSRNYTTAVYVRTTGEKFVYVAGSDGSDKFMAADFSTEEPIDTTFYEDSCTFAVATGYGEDRDNLHLLLITPIYNEDGSYDAVMVLTALQDRLIRQITTTGANILLNVAIWVALLIIVITMVSAYNVKSLKKAKNVVAQIAKGDFSARVDRYSNDEAGDICVGINDMADRLETSFQEKTRNEQFYYKFVPEKFRELLHKENITDLELGDAQSADLTILFCDIRAFSLNSEMMTVRESFEFVNRIYGKAGPIIRKHHGFIDKYIGDAIMALFESAEDAVAAGIELYRAIVLSPDAEKDFGLPEVKVGIGIHSGMAQIGIVGEEERMSGTVISNTVNISSRMESLTKKYGAGMIISKATLDRMSNPDALSTRYLGMVQVAGVNEVAALYEVLDCLEEGTRRRREETKLAFREAVRSFHSGESEHAMELLEQICESDADDKAPRLYAEYIRRQIEQRDTKHKVFRFENKQ